MKQMINDSINFYEGKIAETILEAFLKKELIVESSCSYTDPIGTERFSIQEEDEMHCCEFIELFSIVKYPDWYSELFDLYEYNIEGAYGGIIYSDIDEDFYEKIFKEAKKQCKCVVNEADKPSNLVDYCNWYYAYSLEIAENYDCSTYREDKDLILTMMKNVKKTGADYKSLLKNTFKGANGKEAHMYKEILKELK